jgi:long-chain fatty acid transport protein
VTAQGGTFYFLPNVHYAAPLADDLVFGLSVMTPFAAETNYGLNTNARYAAALSSIYVVDAAPSLGFAYNNKISVGFGMDIEKAYGELSFMTASTSPGSATWNKNTGSSYGYGYHAGILYQPTEQTRIGFNYLSQVIHHLHGGSSRFSGPLAHNGVGGLQYVNNLNMNMALPPTTTLSIFHAINPVWDVMGTVIYTQWNLLNQITVHNMTGISGGASNNGITMIIPEHYRNTWNYSLGANYHVNEHWFIRTGVGYDESPSNNQYRNLQFPDGNQVAIALGTHFQATKTIGLDLGWTHSFIANTRIHNLSQASGDQVTVTNGSIQASTDVYGLEMKWDIT